MKILDKLDKEEMRDIITLGWAVHDGTWFYHALQEFGIDAANKLNKAALKSLSALEMQRISVQLGMGNNRIKNIEELNNFIVEYLELISPETIFTKLKISHLSQNTLHWEWNKGQCFAYKSMTRLGVVDQYECGIIYRIGCWIEDLGIGCRVSPEIDVCLMHKKGECSGKFELVF